MKNFLSKWNQLSKFKKQLTASLLICALIGGLGWYYIDDQYPSWSEEVMLSDGRMLNVHRQHEYVRGYGVRRTWLTFSLPEMGGQQTWSEWMYPAIVDVSEGTVYVVGYTPGVKQFSSYLNPRYQLVAYNWDGKSFTRIPFLNVPEKIRQEWNVLYCSQQGENTTWVAKTAGWCGGHGDFVFGKTRQLELINLKEGAEIQARLQGNSRLFSE